MGVSVFPAASSGLIRKSQTFTSSGTFTLPTGYGAGQPLIIDAEVGGGGGGGGSGAFAAARSGVGGGGGSGVVSLFNNISLTANATITIGAGGTGGAASTGVGNNGSSGGTTDIDSIYFSPGGGAGTGGLTTAGVQRGFSIRSRGYQIQGGYSSSARGGSGGAGGSGGGAGGGNLPTASPDANGRVYQAGSYGMAGGLFEVGNVAGTGGVQNYYTSDTGSGVAFGLYMQNEYAGVQNYGSVAPNLLQRGGGGAGCEINTSTAAGGGGAPGTRNAGGLIGLVNGTKNATNATEPSAGGGGGGGSWSNGSTSGSGGNGAAGYVTIYYWG
jgi:hypothetical protein